MWDDRTLGWLAGIIEGEGCIAFTYKYGVAVAVAMTDRDVIMRLQRESGLGSVYPVKGDLRGNRKPQWCWNVGSRDDVRKLLTAILPILGERRRARAEEAIERLKLNRGRRKKAVCGTTSGHIAHQKRGEQPCEDCRLALNRYNREYYRARKSAA